MLIAQFIKINERNKNKTFNTNFGNSIITSRNIIINVKKIFFTYTLEKLLHIRYTNAVTTSITKMALYYILQKTKQINM